MRTTIDSAGRLVVPKPLRDELGFAPGAELELAAVDGRLEVTIPSRVRVEDGPHGVRFAADAGEPLSAEEVRRVMELRPALTADTSAVIAALSAWHEQHAAAAEALDGVAALPAHVILEAYSVLTRLPSGLAVDPAAAASVLARRFPEAPLRLADAERGGLLERLARAGVFGGAGYDGLVALEAAAHARPLLTLDTRAQTTYQRLGVAFNVIATG